MILSSFQRARVRGAETKGLIAPLISSCYPMKAVNFCYQIGGLLWQDFFFVQSDSGCGELNWRSVRGHIVTDWSSGNF